MPENVERAVAVVGVGAILPDAPDAMTYWENIKAGRYSISDVPEDRWDPKLYFDADHKAPEKTYSTIGGWVREWPWAPLEWRLPIPPKVAEAMDRTHMWAIAAVREALADYGYPERDLDTERTAVVFGNAMGGDQHYMTALRIYFPEYAAELESSPSFAALGEDTRTAILGELHSGVRQRFPHITEDTMPGELANIIAGRVANLYNFNGPNFVVDAACASAMAAIDAAVEGLEHGDYDAVLTGGMDGNMGASTFTKFCKIGALSATGTRPYGEGADGFVMGEGAAVLLLKRLADAERDGDHVYAVIRGIGGASDGKGKGITAPNPVGQRLAVQRAWKNSGTIPDTATYIEGHGTSTRVGDVVEVDGLSEVFSGLGLEPNSIPLGSVKSNIGHLKGAAGAAGMLKAVMALDSKTLPPSINVTRPNPNIDFERSPLFVNTELREWKTEPGQVRSAGVSAFGFGGTNFHIVLEEYVPGRLQIEDRRTLATAAPAAPSLKAPLRGALVVGAADETELVARIGALRDEAAAGTAPPPEPPNEADLRAPVRVAVDYGDAAELADKLTKVLAALESANPGAWKLLNGLGVYMGRGPAHQVALLYTGQGSQYVNMLADLKEHEPIVADTFAEADAKMTPILGRPLSSFIFPDPDDADAVAEAGQQLMQTEITQPAVLATDAALTRLLAAYGVEADMVMGHSLGEYGALVAAGALPFADALEAVAARGKEMAHLAPEDVGLMAAVFAPLEETKKAVESVDGYVVIANVNSTAQAVIGGETPAVQEVMAKLAEAEYQVVQLPVSHAFHTSIVAEAAEPLMQVLRRLDLKPPTVPIVANIDGEFYPMGPAVTPHMVDILGKQVASPVQFVKGLETLYDAGARVFVEVGPKRALQMFAEDVLGDRPDVVTLHTNHPKAGGAVSFNRALCGLYAAGQGVGTQADVAPTTASPATAEAPAVVPAPVVEEAPAATSRPITPAAATGMDAYAELGRMFAEFLDRGYDVYQRTAPARGPAPERFAEPLVVTGAALGLPGTHRVFDDANVGRILHGDQFIDTVPVKVRQAMVDHHITRLVKSEAGGGRFETIASQSEVIKLAARGGTLDLAEEFGYPADRVPALDVVTELAIGAGVDALRDAGIPLTMHYKTTTVNSKLPERWGLPMPLRDETGVIFASAFPGANALVDEVTRYEQDRARRDRLDALNHLQDRISDDDPAVPELEHMIREVVAELEADPYVFDRRFLFKVLSMGHSQFAEYIGARGPNTQINAACASTTQAVALAEDWIRAGRCRRVIIVSADDVTTDGLMGWVGSGFLATGAAATDEVVEDAALPFDKRRHGLLLGMGGAAIVIETAAAARERGVAPICEVLSAVTANSAFHGTRLDVDHIRFVMEDLVAGAEQRWGINRHEIAPQTVFVSHETYTPARGGSAQAEVEALRHVFGPSADRIVIANTKGFTGHPMGVGIEDVVAIKSLETGLVPPIANVKEVDPDFGHLNLSKGGAYPVQYALRLGAGFGSQISLSLMRWYPSKHGIRPEPHQLGYDHRIVDEQAWKQWLSDVSGHDEAEVEEERRTLRIVDRGPATREPVAPRAREPVARTHVARPAPATDTLPVEPSGDVRPVAPLPPPVLPAPAPVETIAPTPAEPPPAPAPVEAAAVGDPVEAQVLAIVAEQTGYPPDMLDPELDLEADLGIDTVKQAETFAAIREAYGIERDDNLALRNYPTLASVVAFVYERAPGLEQPSQTPAAESLPSDTAPAEPPPAPAPVEAAAVGDPVEAQVLAIVAEQTGYPPDMLDPELDLEADLGIDTVKQAETFAAIREAYGIERDDNLALRNYPTLASVVAFVYERAPGLEQPSQTPAAESLPSDTAPAEAVSAGLMEGDDEAAAAVIRRIPTPVLRPALEACVPTGVDIGSGSRIVVMMDRGGVGAALVKRLGKLGADVLAVDDAPEADELLDRIAGFGPIHGVFWLPALDTEDFAAMDIDDWREATRVRVKLLYTAIRHLYDSGAFLVTGTRLGGRHGYDQAGAHAPLGGAVTGFAKAYKRERPDVLVKAVDFPAGRKTAAPAEALIKEAQSDPGVVEVGHVGAARWTIATVPGVADGDEAGVELGPDSVFVITGAAGSIVSAITADLARAAGGGTFHLLDLAPAADAADPDVAMFAADRDGLKRTLFERIKESEGRATPAQVEKELAGIERRHASAAAMQAIENAGGVVHYHQVDLRDDAGMAGAMESVKADGQVDVLLHAGGLEISRLLPDKEPAEFDLVFDVKADGWFNLVKGLEGVPIISAVAFSSIAGRYGNGGQADYSAANDMLCKAISHLRSARPDTRGIAVDWTAWGDIGMATRGSIPTVMKAAGIDMLPAAAGIPIVRQELTRPAPTREIVIAGGLGVLDEELDPGGGVDTESMLDAQNQPGVMVGTLRGGAAGLTMSVELDPREQPFLHDHQIDGTPVLPGVMGLEAFAEVAALAYPDLHVAAIEDVDFHAPFKFYRHEPRQVTVEASFTRDGEDVLAHCRLTGSRVLAGQDEPQRTVHFTGTVRLAAEPPHPAGGSIPDRKGAEVTAESVYSIYFHGPAYQVVANAWRNGDTVAGAMPETLAANHFPDSAVTIVGPRSLELCFQTAGVHEIGTTGVMGLPLHVDRYIPAPADGKPQGRLTALVEAHDDGSFSASVVDEAGTGFGALSGYRTVRLPGAIDDDLLAPLRKAMTGEA